MTLKPGITTIGVVFGGMSGEHKVSIKSAQTIVKALRDKANKSKFHVICFYIDQQGNWLSTKHSEEILRTNIKPN